MSRLVALVKQHEDLSLGPYRCSAGKLTIGYGRNLEDRGITKAEAEYLLENDLAIARNDVSGLVANFEELDEVRQAVLVDMCLNLGGPRFAGFEQMILAVQDEEYSRAADEMVDSKWFAQVKTRAVRLVEMMRSGEWPSE